MSPRGRRTRFRRFLRTGLGIGFLVGSFGFVVLWLTFQHKPSWYRPARVSQNMLQRIRSELAAQAEAVSKQIVERKPFELTLNDTDINEWLAAMPDIWPDTEGALPDCLSDLAVSFDSGLIRIGALYDSNGMRAIINLSLLASIPNDEVSTLQIQLTEVHGGSLPMPRAILEEVLNALPEGPDLGPGLAKQPLSAELGNIRSVDQLFDGVKIRNRFVWPNGERPFRIDAIAVGDGSVTLRLEPL